jgi:hypothetical protein
MDTDSAAIVERSRPRGLWLTVVVVALTTVAIAVPYWTASYDSVRDDGIVGSFSLVALALFLGTFLAGAVTETPLWIVMVGMLGATPVAVLGRVVLDTAADPTSHDLWPLEMVLAVAISVPPIGAAAGFAWAVRRLSPQRP